MNVRNEYYRGIRLSRFGPLLHNFSEFDRVSGFERLWTMLTVVLKQMPGLHHVEPSLFLEVVEQTLNPEP